ncbi:MAG: nuclear transport factor 2 family protein [Coleofasciculaceae cyanobacterium]
MTNVNSPTFSQSQPAHSTDLNIEGVREPVVLRYFQTMNAGEYEATAALFAETGVMLPPFEKPIEGQTAIASYLKAEAQGMQLFPRQGLVETLENDQTQVKVTGKVQTHLFSVNVSWIFVLSLAREITSARIKLLASPEELLKLRR